MNVLCPNQLQLAVLGAQQYSNELSFKRHGDESFSGSRCSKFPSSSCSRKRTHELKLSRHLPARRSPSQQRCFSAALAAAETSPAVVVTRELGKNGKLIRALASKGVTALELPLIEHCPGPDCERLPIVLKDTEFEWVVVTSPEAASVFLEGWRKAGSPALRLAVVGAGTGQVFEAALKDGAPLSIEFSPSKATAKVLAAELPKLAGETGIVLYPSSLKAGNDLEDGLMARGFQVVRLNTYSTETAQNVEEAALKAAAAIPVATFASPTAVRAWMELVAKPRGWDGAAACIGSTSAEAARKAGLTKVYNPDSPGIDGWVDSVLQAIADESKAVDRS